MEINYDNYLEKKILHLENYWYIIFKVIGTYNHSFLLKGRNLLDWSVVLI